MEKPFVKSLTAVAVGAGAIAICLFGYHINNQRQHQQRINYAESAIAIKRHLDFFIKRSRQAV